MKSGRASWPRLFLLAALGAAACIGEPQAPPKPGGIPGNPLWVGGTDGGVFLHLEPRPEGRQTYHARIYADTSGDVLYDGLLTTVPDDHGPIDVHDASVFSGWDGDSLYLTDGAKLSRFRPEEPPAK